MFREWRSGLMLFMSAIVGMALGHSCLVPNAYSGADDYIMRQAAIGLVGGAVLGSATWLVYRYARLPP
jgi:hypothetical protein